MRKLLLVSVALFGFSSVAFADQGVFDYPVLGTTTPACGGFVNGVCAYLQAPGPASLTGLETIPADTNAPQGQAPQTIEIPVLVLGAGLTSYQSPLTGTTITSAAGTSNLVLTPAGTIAALTVALPPAATNVDGAIFTISTSQTVTALTVTAGVGNSLISSPTTLTANNDVSFIWRASNTSWYVL